MDELFNIFDEFYTKTGVASRTEVHKNGLWHETFHCWIYYRSGSEIYLYFQQRAETKKDYPGMFDITAAGHLLSTETVRAGVREIKEELGIEVNFSDLEYVGCVPVSITLPTIIDREFTNVFVLEHKYTQEDFTLQEEEVQGIYEVPLSELKKVLDDDFYETTVNGFTMENAKMDASVKLFNRKNLCAFYPEYYTFLINFLQKL